MPTFLPAKQSRQMASGLDTGEAVLVRITSKIMGDNAMRYTQAITMLHLKRISLSVYYPSMSLLNV